MEKIELKVLSNNGVPLSQGMSAVFGIAGGTIGRGGQNKLILSGVDGTVARVHAMVRLDHAGAYIANLSESKPIWVEDRIVQSGEEVVLALHENIRIGSYALRAEACGSTQLSTSPDGQQAKVSALADVRNSIDEPTVTDKLAPVSCATAKSPSLGFKQGAESQQIAALGSISCDETLGGLLPISAPSNDVGFVDLFATDIGVHVDGKSLLSQPSRAGEDFSQGLIAAKIDQSFENIKVPLRSPDAEMLAHQVANLTPERNMALVNNLVSGVNVACASVSVPQQPFPALIPDDFNPFAVKCSDAEKTPEAWSATGLILGNSPVGNLSRDFDQLVRNLPLQGKLARELDNPSHPGLPQKYATATVLDPLALFGEGELEGDPFATAAALPRGPELSQAFDLPRSQIPTLNEHLLPGFDSIVSPIAQQCLAGAIHVPHQLIPPVTVSGGLGASDVIPEQSHAEELSGQPHLGTADASFDALAAAFAKGAGLDPSAAQFHVTPEFMHTFGDVLRVAIQGTIDLLAARSEIKREFRAGMTIIASGANNPLKFLPSAEGVIMQMTNRAFPGFMPPVPAMEEAFMDLRVHQLALMAGITAAYSDALTRFDPVELERRGEIKNKLIDILFNARKAALWDDYKNNFETLRRHAEDDLIAFSGRSFLNAYEQAELAAKNDQGSAP